jgi:transcriptional regulator with XRE-family HTH domain
MTAITVGKRIKQARENAKLTQKELAQKAGKGFSTIQKYEMDLVTPPLDVLRKIANVLNVSVADLLTIDPHTRWATQDDFDRFAAGSGNEVTDADGVSYEFVTKKLDKVLKEHKQDVTLSTLSRILGIEDLKESDLDNVSKEIDIEKEKLISLLLKKSPATEELSGKIAKVILMMRKFKDSEEGKS